MFLQRRSDSCSSYDEYGKGVKPTRPLRKLMRLQLKDVKIPISKTPNNVFYLEAGEHRKKILDLGSESCPPTHEL